MSVLLFCSLGSCKPALKQLGVKPAFELEFHGKATKPGLPLCRICDSFAGQCINELLNIILSKLLSI